MGPHLLCRVVIANLRVLALIGILINLLATPGHSQAVVISEYYNDNPPQEWTELLVIQDDLDLRGWIVTDNNASQTARQGGVRFRNIPYWQHVRAGTIIGIWHRDYISSSPQDFDTSMADGRVMLAKNDTRFFEPYAAPGVEFPEAPMNLAQEGDIMQILDANGSHVHGFGHRATPGSYWIAMPEPKLNTASALNNGQSNRVFPGSMLSQYNGPHGAPLSEACAVNITRTLPNRPCGSSNSNWEFWHNLRRPLWPSPQLQLAVNASTVQLSWSAAQDPYPMDGLQGYIVVRDSAGQNFIPEQGRIYQNGERIGSAIILAHLPSTATTYTDAVSLSCGVTYTYRVFAYRFGQDDEYGAYPAPQSTRGRQYNTVAFASATAIKQVERGPSLQTDGSPTTFCAGGSITLSVPTIPPGYSAQWLRNGSVITGANQSTYRATESGEYRLRLQRPDGCFVLSDSIIITVRPTPTATVFPSTRIQLCEDSTQLLQTAYVEGWRYQWYRDNQRITGATNASYAVTQAGSYSVEVINEYGCSARSGTVAVDLIQLQVALQPSTIVFPSLTGCESYRDVSVTIRNLSGFPFTIIRALEPEPFVLVSPSLPDDVNSGEERTLTLRFAPTNSGSWIDSVGLQLQPCGRIFWIRVSGTKTGQVGTLSAQTPIKDFGVLTRCNGIVTPRLDSITITASGDLVVEGISIAMPFRLAPGFPTNFTLRAGESRIIPIEFAPVLDRSYSRDLTIHYTSSQCRDSITIPLRGTLATPYIALSAREIVFPPLDSCTSIFSDTTVTLYNMSLAPIQIEQLSDEQVQIVSPVPMPTLTIQPRDSLTIRLRYSPAGYVAGQQLAVLFGDRRCTQSEVLIVRGTRSGTSLSLSRQQIQFPRLLHCREHTPLTEHALLNVVSIPPGIASATVVSVSSSAPWLTTSLTPGELPEGQYPFSITIDPRFIPVGTNTATVSIRIEPCSRFLTLPVSVTVEELSLGFTESNGQDTLHVELGTVAVNTFRTITATIQNNNHDTIHFAPIGNLPPWISINMPFVLPPLSAGTADITILVEKEGRFSDTILLEAIEPCSKHLLIIVSGRGTQDTLSTTPQALRLVIPENIIASPGDEVYFSLLCEGLQRPLRFDSLIIPLRFDRTLLYLERVSVGNAADVGSLSSTATEYGYRFGFHNVNIRQNGSLLYLAGRALLGRTQETPLVPDRNGIVLSDTTLTISTVIPGSLRLANRCNLEERLVEVGSNPSLIIRDDGNNLLLTVNHIVDAEAAISLYDIAGRLILPLHLGHLNRGTHTFEINRTNLGAGLFFAVYRTDGINQTVLLLFP